MLRLLCLMVLAFVPVSQALTLEDPLPDSRKYKLGFDGYDFGDIYIGHDEDKLPFLRFEVDDHVNECREGDGDYSQSGDKTCCDNQTVEFADENGGEITDRCKMCLDENAMKARFECDQLGRIEFDTRVPGSQ